MGTSAWTIHSSSGGNGQTAWSAPNVGVGANSAVVSAKTTFLNGWNFTNNGAAPVYVRLYNLATLPISSSIPQIRFMIPAGGVNTQTLFKDEYFTVGLAVLASTVNLDTDQTAPASNQVIGNLFYN